MNLITVCKFTNRRNTIKILVQKKKSVLFFIIFAPKFNFVADALHQAEPI